jgi:hypothetical protein
MAALEALIFAGVAGFTLVIVITFLVIVGIHREERYLTLANRNAPGAVAQLARLVLGRYVRRENDPEARGRRQDDEAFTPDRRRQPWD